MMEIFRLVVGTAILGWLFWILGKTVIQGIMTGSIRHTDASRLCRRKNNPVGFWALVILFTGFILGIGSSWVFMVVDIISDMK